MLRHPFLELRRSAIIRNHAEDLAVEAVDESEPGTAKAHRTLGYGLKHWPQIERRSADHFEQIGGGGLLLERLAQLVEQAGVFDGNDGLTGEALDQLDLLVCERPHFLPVDGDRADQFTLLEHRHPEGRASTAEVGESDQPRIAFEIWRHRSDVVDVYRLFGPANLGLATFGMNAERHVLRRGERGRYIVDSGDTGYVSIV